MGRNIKNIDSMVVTQIRVATCHVLGAFSSETWTCFFVLLWARDDPQLPAANHTASTLYFALVAGGGGGTPPQKTAHSFEYCH
jgi:hypothetical protein